MRTWKKKRKDIRVWEVMFERCFEYRWVFREFYSVQYIWNDVCQSAPLCCLIFWSNSGPQKSLCMRTWPYWTIPWGMAIITARPCLRKVLIVPMGRIERQWLWIEPGMTGLDDPKVISMPTILKPFVGHPKTAGTLRLRNAFRPILPPRVLHQKSPVRSVESDRQHRVPTVVIFQLLFSCRRSDKHSISVDILFIMSGMFALGIAINVV